MPKIPIRREEEKDACGEVAQEDLRLKHIENGWHLFVTPRGTWILKIPPEAMHPIPYVIPSDKTLLNLLQKSRLKKTDEDIKKKIAELTSSELF